MPSLTLIKVGKKINISIDLIHLTIIKDGLLESTLICVRIEEGGVGVGVGAFRGQERSWKGHCFESAEVKAGEPWVIKDLSVAILTLSQSCSGISVEQLLH